MYSSHLSFKTILSLWDCSLQEPSSMHLPAVWYQLLVFYCNVKNNLSTSG